MTKYTFQVFLRSLHDGENRTIVCHWREGSSSDGHLQTVVS